MTSTAESIAIFSKDWKPEPAFFQALEIVVVLVLVLDFSRPWENGAIFFPSFGKFHSERLKIMGTKS
jgi:hypothetical protein